MCFNFNPTMKRGGGGWIMPTEEEVDIASILLKLPKSRPKSVLINGYSFIWGRKKKRSVLNLQPDSPAAEAEKSPSTPLCFLPIGGGCDGGDNRKPLSSVKKILKRKAMEVYSRMQQEREIVMKKLAAMKTLHQERTYENLELKAKGQKINYPTNMGDFSIWNTRYHQQNTMFVPAKPQQHCVQPLVRVSCSSNSNGGDRFGLMNQIDPRVKVHGETYEYDFMSTPQLLDQSKYLVMDNDLRVRAAADARKRRMLRIKENKKSLLAMKLSNSKRV